MLMTIALSFVMMAGLFLMLWAEVGFIQNKQLASSAPKEVRAAIPQSKPERSRGQHALGWCMAVASLLLIAGAIVLGAGNGIRNRFSFEQFFVRFAAMMLLFKAFDLAFFDWFLLCNKGLNFFPHYYPEVEKELKASLFGFNWKSHVVQVIVLLAGSLVLAWICSMGAKA